ncbi:hypothetical protein KIL84_015461 [Mauremys mutica]|uniref:G-protein coupled receptors family 1 profile domain-containing protein n=1 Tax=Mauremys mutica TaxID=74926 RepID=A0A9D4APY5_9SAUR|nr:hypothetical protein KIL84_015461 [Mauremys mutica]
MRGARNCRDPPPPADSAPAGPGLLPAAGRSSMGSAGASGPRRREGSDPRRGLGPDRQRGGAAELGTEGALGTDRQGGGAGLGTEGALAPRQIKGRAKIHLPAGEEAGRNATFSGSSPESYLRSPLTRLILPTLYSMVLLVGLPANALAFWVLATKTKKCTSTLFLLNLAGADLLFTLLLPFKISYHLLGNNWLLGDYACRALVTLFYGNMYGSILFLTCISLDRYISLVHPFRWRGSRHIWQAAGVCVGVWLAVGLGLSPLLRYPHSQHVPELNITTCHDILEPDTERELAYYFPALVVLGFAMPFVLITFSYGWVLWRLLRRGRHYGHVVRLLVLVLLIFALCFTPSNVLLFCHYLQPQPEWHNRTYTWRGACPAAKGLHLPCLLSFQLRGVTQHVTAGFTLGAESGS